MHSLSTQPSRLAILGLGTSSPVAGSIGQLMFGISLIVFWWR